MTLQKDLGIGEKTNLIEDDLFDDTGGYETDIGALVPASLSELEKKRASILYNYFNELMGIMIVKGDPGTGKDLFGNYLQYNIKRWFPWKNTLRDSKPRRLFGKYTGLFNPEVLYEDLQKMKEVAKGGTKGAGTYLNALEKAAEEWVASNGEVLLKNSTLYLEEYWRYCYNREPHNPMNKTMGGIQRMKRHIDVLIIGTSQLTTDLDKKTSLPWIDWRVDCVRSRKNITWFTYIIDKVRYDRRLDTLIALPGTRIFIDFDAGKPMSDMGDGKIVLRKPDYEPKTAEERIVLYAIKQGYDNYEGLVDLLETDGDMKEKETLDTLKSLGLKLPGRKPKFVIWYPCYLHIYNSKNPPGMDTKLKVSN